MDIIDENITLIRERLSNQPELKFAEQQIAKLPKTYTYTGALDKHVCILFRQLDVIAIIVQSAAKYIDRTQDYSLEPCIDVIGSKMREIRNKR